MEFNYGANLEIHFHQQNEVSIFLENTTSGEDEIKSDLFLLSFFIARKLANLEQDNSIGQSLAFVLENIEEQLDKIFDPNKFDDVLLVPYKGVRGRKRFLAHMVVSDERVNFRLKPKGFGILGKGLGYYSPVSAIMLIKYMGNKYRNNIKAKNGIIALCKYSGQLAPQITPVSQVQFAPQIASVGIGIFDGSLEQEI